MGSSLPNVVLVVFDTARKDRFGCYGYGRPTTPGVDALAAEGMKADAMFTNAPWTLPSHASLFTGLYPSQHGCQWQTGPGLRHSVRQTMPEWFAAQGYRTVCATTNGLISRETGLARGFDDYAFRMTIDEGRTSLARRVKKVAFGDDSDGRVVNDWIEQQLSSVTQPLFLFVNYLSCHWSYTPPLRLQRRVGGPRFRFPQGLRYRMGTARKQGPWEAMAAADDRTREIYSALYDAELAAADAHLERLLDVLAAAGRMGSEETIVIVTSDHGEHLGEHGLADHQGSLSDRLINVPFVAWGPGIVPSTDPDGTYEFVDVFPSLARLLGRDLDDRHLAERRSDLFVTPRRRRDDVAFAEWRSWGGTELDRLARKNPSYDLAPLARDVTAARDGRLKLVRRAGEPDRLYDVASDPNEERDVAAELPEEATRLAGLLDAAALEWAAWEEEEADLSDADQQLIEDQLSQLGYI